jgi:hypothetical protein
LSRSYSNYADSLAITASNSTEKSEA